MPEISGVQLDGLPPGILPAALGSAPWLRLAPGPEPRIAWWGCRGLPGAPAPTADPVRTGLLPRAVEGPAEGPWGVVLATLDADRAAADLAPILGAAWGSAGEDAVLGARCKVARLARTRLVLAEPITEGYLAACLARFGEGPVAVAVAVDPPPGAGREVVTNPVTGGRATWLRLGRGTAPYLLLVAA